MNARRLRRIEGLVWCDRHGNVHDGDDLDPFDYGVPEEFCEEAEHRPIYGYFTQEESP